MMQAVPSHTSNASPRSTGLSPKVSCFPSPAKPWASDRHVHPGWSKKASQSPLQNVLSYSLSLQHPLSSSYSLVTEKKMDVTKAKSDPRPRPPWDCSHAALLSQSWQVKQLNGAGGRGQSAGPSMVKQQPSHLPSSSRFCLLTYAIG